VTNKPRITFSKENAMLKKIASQILSILTSVTLLIPSFSGTAGAVGPAPVAMPDFVKALTPPDRLGYVDSFYKGNTEHPVILIEDLHANYGVQRKIEGLLEHYQPLLTEGGHKMILGIEGAWGKMDLSEIRKVAEKTRQAESDFLLKESEISGMEHFATLSSNPVEFYGIDNPKDYFVHRELFRTSLTARMQLAGKIDKLREAIALAKVDGNKEMLRLWKMADDFHAGKVGLDDLSRSLNVKLANYADAEDAIAKAQDAAVSRLKGDSAFKVKNIVVADRNLEILARLFRQQLTLEEVQYVSQRIPQILMVVQTLMPGENLQLWKDTVRAAIDHYAIALVRNKPMAEHARELVQQYPESSPVIVTGGFHTAGIADEFKAKKISYVIVAPVVEGQTAHDERVYLKRMMGLHVTNDQIAQAAHSFARASTVPAVGDTAAAAMTKANVPGFPLVEPETKVEQQVRQAFEKGTDPKAALNAENPQDAAAVEAVINEGTPSESVQSPSGVKAALSNLVPDALQANKAAEIKIDENKETKTSDQVNPNNKNSLGDKGKILGIAIVATLGTAAVSHGADIANNSHALTSVVAPAVNSGSLNFALSMASTGHHPHAAVAAALVTAGAVAMMAWNKFRAPNDKELLEARNKISFMERAKQFA
jgi:hypothetical protein